MKITEVNSNSDHERVVCCEDDVTGLKAIIAIHSTLLGPAAGGCRMFNYASFEEALTDVLRLSRGMTFKNAAAGLDLGGGKAVIIGDPKTDKTPDLMRAFGRFVHSLEGKYYTAEDVGISVADIEVAAEATPYAVGISHGEFASGDPSPYTARGVFLSMQQALVYKFGTDDFKGVSVAIQGLGHVGMYLAEYLYAAGAKLIVADINEHALQEAKDKFNVEVVDVKDIHRAKVDVFSPCAMGGALSQKVIAELNCHIVCGAANNQLVNEECGESLVARDILYGPDYVINSGGIIQVATEIFQISEANWADQKIEEIARFTGSIFAMAIANKVSPHKIADQLVYKRLQC